MSSKRQNKSNSKHSPTKPASRYLLRRNLGLWQLTFEGQEAILKHEQGLYYVAYLLTHPQQEAIHGLALALRTEQTFNPSSAVTQMADPSTGKLIPVEPNAQLSEYNLQLEDARAAWAMRRNQLELEALADDETQPEPVKAEALRQLEAIYDYQKTNLGHITTAAQRAVRTVRMAITRFHRRLLGALDLEGRPHLVLRNFAAHLERYLLVPSARYSGLRCNKRLGLAGRSSFMSPRPACFGLAVNGAGQGTDPSPWGEGVAHDA